MSSNSSHLHPLQVGNCNSNSRLVVGEDDNGKFGLEGVKGTQIIIVRSYNIMRRSAAMHTLSGAVLFWSLIRAVMIMNVL